MYSSLLHVICSGFAHTVTSHVTLLFAGNLLVSYAKLSLVYHLFIGLYPTISIPVGYTTSSVTVCPFLPSGIPGTSLVSPFLSLYLYSIGYTTEVIFAKNVRLPRVPCSIVFVALQFSVISSFVHHAINSYPGLFGLFNVNVGVSILYVSGLDTFIPYGITYEIVYVCGCHIAYNVIVSSPAVKLLTDSSSEYVRPIHTLLLL